MSLVDTNSWILVLTYFQEGEHHEEYRDRVPTDSLAAEIVAAFDYARRNRFTQVKLEIQEDPN